MSDETKILTPEAVAEMQARANAATPGPWSENGDHAINGHDEHPVANVYTLARYQRENVANHAFIAAARADIPALAASHEALRAALADERAHADRMVDDLRLIAADDDPSDGCAWADRAKLALAAHDALNGLSARNTKGDAT